MKKEFYSVMTFTFGVSGSAQIKVGNNSLHQTLGVNNKYTINNQ